MQNKGIQKFRLPNFQFLNRQNFILFFCVTIILYTANNIRVNLRDLLIGDYSLSEFLINYQGGFVRRGILGELVFRTSDPVFFATLLQKVH